MFFPLRDVIIPRTTPVMTWGLAAGASVLQVLWCVTTTDPVGVLSVLQLTAAVVALLVFGENVEDQVGRERFLLLVLVCGAAASASHLRLSSGALSLPAGINGAVAGVLGAYFVMFLHSRLLVRLPFTVLELPALFFLGFWLLLQTGGTSFAAPIGGLLTGAALIRLFRRPERARWEWREP